jgi:hypothetical protein
VIASQTQARPDPHPLGVDRSRIAADMFRELDNRVVLGVGKPVRLLNAIYEHAKCHPEVRLTIVTALTLTEEGSSSALGWRLSDPILRRLFGGGPEPCWRADQVAGQIPPNIDVRDFYLTPGRSTNVRAAQQAHISANYHHVAQLPAEMGTNAIVQDIHSARSSPRSKTICVRRSLAWSRSEPTPEAGPSSGRCGKRWDPPRLDTSSISVGWSLQVHEVGRRD